MPHPKIAVVAGGSAGVGRAVVDALIIDGYKVGVLARGKERLNEIDATYAAISAASRSIFPQEIE